ncbi:GerMN domain-containing protein [Micromonospora sp. CPCC 206061]|uniref:GerMN domain-containing protein n=1 Tax=Micromonospora sp. CPCC 206061 TaxID=3122410 RepID=UPI002FF3AC13
MTGRRALTAFAAAVLVLAAGCGVTVQQQPQEVQPPRGPHRILASGLPDTPDPGTAEELLYFTRDGTLVPTTRRVRVAPTAETLVRDLVAGPNDAERNAGLASALTGTTLTLAGRHGSQITIEMDEPVAGTGRSDEVLAYGQVVTTLTARPEITSITFTRGGERIGIPRADGSLSEVPLTAADYASLITHD